MSTESDHDRIVGDLYEAATRPEHWPAALAGLARWSGADQFHLMRWDSASQQSTLDVHSEGVEAAIEEYGAYYATIDPRRMLVAAGPAGQVSACQHRFEDRYVERSEFYQDFLGAWGMRRSLSSLLVQEGDDQLMLGLVRSSERGRFEDDEVARLERVMPHLQRSCRMWMRTQRLEEETLLGDRAAESAGLAWLALDRAGHLLHASPQAEHLLREGDSLVLRGGRVHAAEADDAFRFQSAISQAARGEPGTELSLAGCRSGPRACDVSVVGAPTLQSGRAAVLVVIARRDAAGGPTAARLVQAFGLTAAESRVGLALLEGKTPAEYAAAAGLSLATVRTHLSAVFAKTGTRRQAEAVQVLRGLRL